MNAVISVNHFCEIHGPQVLFCTQTFHDDAPFSVNQSLSQPTSPRLQRRFYGNTDILRTTEISVPECEACRSLDKNYLGLISSDHNSRTSFVSSQHPLTANVMHLTKQACLRSLSCELTKETAAKGDQPVFFGDAIRGNVLSVAFSIRDAQARGFHRQFSFCVLMRDALFLLQAWPFLTSHFQTVISQLQENATKVYIKEQAQCPQRALRLNAGAAMANTTCKQECAPCTSTKQEIASSPCKPTNKVTRSLSELTGEPLVYQQLHRWFVWLLKAGASRLEEKLCPPPFLKDVSVHSWGAETEEGFVLIPTPTTLETGGCSNHDVRELEASGSTVSSSNFLAGPQVQGGIAELYKLLGRSQFLSVAHCLLVGHQLVVRCEWPSLASGIIQALKAVVTRAVFRAKVWSVSYVSPLMCSLLGLPPSATLPSPLPSNVLVLDVVAREGKEGGLMVLGERVDFSVKYGNSKTPAKWPTLLLKMDKALQNSFLTPTALHCHLVALKEEWLNISRTVMRLHQTGTSSADLSKLMSTLGAQTQDWPLISYWGTLHRQ